MRFTVMGAEEATRVARVTMVERRCDRVFTYDKYSHSLAYDGLDLGNEVRQKKRDR